MGIDERGHEQLAPDHADVVDRDPEGQLIRRSGIMGIVLGKFVGPMRPVIPLVGRGVTVPWQLGEYQIPAGGSILMTSAP